MQRVPQKPGYLSLSDAEWGFILDRDQRRCSDCRNCQEQHGVVGYCSENLDVDYKHPKELGGDRQVVS